MSRNGYTLMISFNLYENFLAWKPCQDTFQVHGFLQVMNWMVTVVAQSNKIDMQVSEGYEMLDKFDSSNVNQKSPYETKLGSNVGDERKNAIFSAQFQTNARQKTKLELGQGYSGAPLPNKVTTTSTKSHFMNSVFVQPGVYSCATDCQRDLISF